MDSQQDHRDQQGHPGLTAWLSVISAIILLATALLVFIFTDITEDISKLRDRLDRCCEKAQTTETDVAALKPRLSGVEEQLSDQKTTSSTLQTGLETLRVTTASNTDDITALRSELAAFRDRMTNMQLALYILDTKSDAMRVEVGGIHKRLLEVAQSYDKASAEISKIDRGNTAAIAEQRKRLDKLSAELEALHLDYAKTIDQALQKKFRFVQTER